MICNQKSALTTVATAAQTVAANGFVGFPTNNLLTGVSIKHPAGSTSVDLIQGLYLVTLNADITPTAAGDTYNISFATLLRVLPSCCVINNNLELQVQATAAGTISNASLSVVKMA